MSTTTKSRQSSKMQRRVAHGRVRRDSPHVDSFAELSAVLRRQNRRSRELTQAEYDTNHPLVDSAEDPAADIAVRARRRASNTTSGSEIRFHVSDLLQDRRRSRQIAIDDPDIFRPRRYVLTPWPSPGRNNTAPKEPTPEEIEQQAHEEAVQTARSWIDAANRTPNPLVAIRDHLKHLSLPTKVDESADRHTLTMLKELVTAYSEMETHPESVTTRIARRMRVLEFSLREGRSMANMREGYMHELASRKAHYLRMVRMGCWADDAVMEDRWKRWNEDLARVDTWSKMEEERILARREQAIDILE